MPLQVRLTWASASVATGIRGLPRTYQALGDMQAGPEGAQLLVNRREVGIPPTLERTVPEGLWPG